MVGRVLEWPYFEIRSVFFSADFSCESASHHFVLFFFETGSLVGCVVLELPCVLSGWLASDIIR